MSKKFERTRGRKVNGTFLPLPSAVTQSKAFASLPAHAVKLLVDLGSAYSGHNNGDLCAAWSLMEARGWRSRDTLRKAKEALLDAGFIQVTRQGGKRVATLYAVTWLRIDECKHKLDVQPTKVPSNLWRVHENRSRDTPTVSKLHGEHLKNDQIDHL